MWSPNCCTYYCFCYKCNLHYDICFNRAMNPPRVSSRIAANFSKKALFDDDDYPAFYRSLRPWSPTPSRSPSPSPPDLQPPLTSTATSAPSSPSPSRPPSSPPSELQPSTSQPEHRQSTTPVPEGSAPASISRPLRAATAPRGTPAMDCFYCCPDGGADHKINKCWNFVAGLTTQQQMRVLTSQSRCFCCWKKSFRTCKEHNCWCFNCGTEEHLTIFCWRGRRPDFVTIRGGRPDKK